jgi:urease accessory protein UreE
LRQLREKVIRIELPGSSSEIAQLAWQIGNLHQPVDVRETFLLVADDPALRRVLKKGVFKFEIITETFTPPAHSAFAAHQYVPGLEYQHSHFFGISHGAGV